MGGVRNLEDGVQRTCNRVSEFVEKFQFVLRFFHAEFFFARIFSPPQNNISRNRIILYNLHRC